jgi:C4-dicarboxylate transporter DctM subunit
MAALPYMGMLALGIVLIIAVPDIALWLPRVAGY